MTYIAHIYIHTTFCYITGFPFHRHSPQSSLTCSSSYVELRGLLFRVFWRMNVVSVLGTEASQKACPTPGFSSTPTRMSRKENSSESAFCAIPSFLFPVNVRANKTTKPLFLCLK